MSDNIFSDLRLSRLMLGTVQLGIDYGVANRSGRPAYETARDIIACAWENGINCLDTAADYGASEEVIGRALDELGLAGSMTVITKVSHLPAEVGTEAEVRSFVEASVIRSLRRLRLEALPICLLHNEADYTHIEALMMLQERGLVRYAGCSVMTPEVALPMLADPTVRAVQIPVNMLDRRFLASGFCDGAGNEGKALLARSIYLQGLLLMPEEDIPASLMDVIPVRRRLQAIADAGGLGPAEAAMRFVMGLPGITSILVGAETPKQVRDNALLSAAGPLPSEMMEEILALDPGLPDRVILPTLWKG